MIIRQREGMAVFPAQHPELTFKIRAPDLIVLTDVGQRLAVARRSASALFIRDQAFAPEDIADSAGGRYGKINTVIKAPHPQFFRAPVRMLMPQGDQMTGDIIRDRPGMRTGSA